MKNKLYKKLAIRVSTDSKFGRGHIVRCLAIRSHIKCKTAWYIDKRENEVIKMIPKYDDIVIEEGVSSCSKIKDSIKKKAFSMVLLDSYMISHAEYLKIRKYVPLVVISDEFKNINADLAIYPHPVNNCFNNSKNFLFGLKYALLGKDFEAINKIKKSRTKKELNILVSMGTMDRAGVTLTAIKSLNKILRNSNYKFKIIIVLGDKSPLRVHVRSLTNLVKNYKILINHDDMKLLYTKCTIAIGAPGQSHLERLKFGLPTILVAQNKLHRPIISKWERLGCGIKSNNSVPSLTKNILFLLSNKALLLKMRKKSELIIDGLGASRVALAMSRMF